MNGGNVLSFHELSTLPTIIAGTGEGDGLATAAPCDFDGLKFIIIYGGLWGGGIVGGRSFKEADWDRRVDNLRDEVMISRCRGIQGIGVEGGRRRNRKIVRLVVEFLESLVGHSARSAITTEGLGASEIVVVGTIWEGRVGCAP